MSHRRKIMVKTKNRFQAMRSTLDHTGFNVVAFARIPAGHGPPLEGSSLELSIGNIVIARVPVSFPSSPSGRPVS